MSKKAHEHIGFSFLPPTLYAPQTSGDYRHISVRTLLPEGTQPVLELTLNGQPYHGELISLHTHGTGGLLWLEDAFAETYAGPWPALLAVRYVKDGIVVDEGPFQLRDPRTATPHRLEPSVVPEAIRPPRPGEPASLTCDARFFDSNGIPVSSRGLEWEVILPHPRPGVRVVDGHRIEVTHEAQPGVVAVWIRERSGIEAMAAFSVLRDPDA